GGRWSCRARGTTAQFAVDHEGGVAGGAIGDREVGERVVVVSGSDHRLEGSLRTRDRDGAHGLWRGQGTNLDLLSHGVSGSWFRVTSGVHSSFRSNGIACASCERSGERGGDLDRR